MEGRSASSQRPLVYYCKWVLYSLAACFVYLPDPCVCDVPTGARLSNRNVAIIGGGIGGATTAYMLANSSAHYNITVFEASSRLGGRLEEVELGDGSVVELGGSIGISANKYFVHFVELLGLQRKPPSTGDATLGIWNGTHFDAVIDGTWESALAAFLRYGVSSFAADRIVAEAVRRFDRIYELQTSGIAFTTSADLWGALHLHHLTETTLEEHLRSRYRLGAWNLINKHFVEEVAAVFTRVNYNQSPDSITALAGLIGMAPDDTSFGVVEGTSKIPRGLLGLSGAEVRLDSPVRIVRRVGKQWSVETVPKRTGEEGASDGAGDVAGELFDAVVIATPMNDAHLRVAGLQGGEPGWPPKQAYQTVFRTYVRGKLRPSYFGVAGDGDIPTFVGTTQGGSAPFTSLSTLRNDNGTRLVTLFSVEPFGAQAMRQVFEDAAEVLVEKEWAAYPRYSAPEPLGEFQVASGLYYLNSIEVGASCIEVSAVSGKNAALLLARHFADDASVPEGERLQANVRSDEL